uniref:Uncharacterized protein n=1 Tax=Glossina palpalis gambiensis TaxID=67801 RepID=A0A1B0C0S2_9MUSC
KKDLITYLIESNQETTSSVEQLRRKLAQLITTEHKAEEIGRVLDLQILQAEPAMTIKSVSTLKVIIPEESLRSVGEKHSIMEQGESEILNNKALTLYRHNNKHRTFWEFLVAVFLKLFLPPRYLGDWMMKYVVELNELPKFLKMTFWP